MQWSDLFPVDPYAGFIPTHTLNTYGWNAHEPIFERLIREKQPQLIIEVGTWKGASALHMAELTKELQTTIVCVDTWLGAIEFWKNDDDPTRDLEFKHGYPQVYYQFLSNVVHKGYEHRIIPFPQTGVTAARWFRQKGINADLIYIDASHEYEDVLADIEAYWPIVKPGGVIFGDDYPFPEVHRAVHTFAAKHRLSVTAEDFKWSIVKP